MRFSLSSVVSVISAVSPFISGHSERESEIRPEVQVKSLISSQNGRDGEARPAADIVREKSVRGSNASHVDGKALCGHLDLRNARCYENSEPVIYEKAMAVAKIRAGDYVCTGWLVGGNNHLMTNHHCIGSEAEAASAQFLFMYESAQGGCQQGGVRDADASAEMTINGAEFIMADQGLDFSLVKLNGNPVCSYG